MNSRPEPTACEQWRSASPLIQLLAGRWTIDVLAELQHSGRRYQELDDALDGVSHKVLTDTLRRLERDGLVARLVDPSRVDTATLYFLEGCVPRLGPAGHLRNGWLMIVRLRCDRIRRAFEVAEPEGHAWGYRPWRIWAGGDGWRTGWPSR